MSARHGRRPRLFLDPSGVWVQGLLPKAGRALLWWPGSLRQGAWVGESLKGFTDPSNAAGNPCQPQPYRAEAILTVNCVALETKGLQAFLSRGRLVHRRTCLSKAILIWATAPTELTPYSFVSSRNRKRRVWPVKAEIEAERYHLPLETGSRRRSIRWTGG